MWHNVAEKYFIIWYSWFDFIDLKEFIVDSINYLGWELNFSIRTPRVFKILSTKFQRTKTTERDLVERSCLSNSRWHSANADVIADVKSNITVSRWHFFVDVIFSATLKVQNYQNPYTQTNIRSLHISRNFKDIFKYICFTLYL